MLSHSLFGAALTFLANPLVGGGTDTDTETGGSETDGGSETGSETAEAGSESDGSDTGTETSATETDTSGSGSESGAEGSESGSASEGYDLPYDTTCGCASTREQRPVAIALGLIVLALVRPRRER